MAFHRYILPEWEPMTDDRIIPGNLLTTAMAVMPHVDVDRALETALSLDVPFWPQRPNDSYCEDMYVQAAEHFPGILLDVGKRTLRFSVDKFAEELDETMQHFDDPAYFDVSATYAAVYQRFLALDLAAPPADRGPGFYRRQAHGRRSKTKMPARSGLVLI
jgi:hypothetical protein